MCYPPTQIPTTDQPVYLPTSLLTYLPTYPTACLPIIFEVTQLPMHPPTHIPIYLPTDHIHLPTHLPTHPPTYSPTHLPTAAQHHCECSRVCITAEATTDEKQKVKKQLPAKKPPLLEEKNKTRKKKVSWPSFMEKKPGCARCDKSEKGCWPCNKPDDWFGCSKCRYVKQGCSDCRKPLDCD